MNVKNSVAFNKTPVCNINKTAQTIDQRLFLFAYYNPKEFPESESVMVQFYTAVINLYGLFWDCGLFVKTCLLHNRQINSLLECDDQGFTKKGMDINKRFINLTSALSGLRNSACHNNAQEFYYNRINRDNTNNFFSNLGLNSTTLSIGDWQNCLYELCKQGDDVISDIGYCLDWLKSVSQSDKDKIIQVWLNNGICQWYLDRKLEMDGYLEELQQFYCYKFSKKRQKLVSWLNNNFKTSDCFYWLNHQSLSDLLSDASQCPKPALPIDVFKALTKDVYKFATTGSH